MDGTSKYELTILYILFYNNILWQLTTCSNDPESLNNYSNNYSFFKDYKIISDTVKFILKMTGTSKIATIILSDV